ncbi:hypothetical protein SAMN05421693_13419 [Ectothiorhodospira magna]|uniref:Uncharacterized protein n=1 Tax=Ectothiorhodospira magna TaxID=867345 RepID=A0A1H9GA88_9GAMM|nr:FeoB-associated Cys-rich membrane protein [Ectothiorhodospira magna]SEQ46974.1 hypothetical protein SAMN05421693_13419 [Ectothiorhodospira magna]
MEAHDMLVQAPSVTWIDILVTGGIVLAALIFLWRRLWPRRGNQKCGGCGGKCR